MAFQGFFRELGRRLRAAREKAGLSVSDAARDAGVSRRTLTEAEAGRANPSVAVLLRLAGTLGTTPAQLLDIPLRGHSGERVALLGLRGAGKSTVGRRLATELETPFVELDERVEARAGLSLAEIFDLHGEAYFREVEAEALEEVLGEGERVVIATGGSIVNAPETYRRVLDTCRTIWLRADAGDHYRRVVDQGDPRPMKNRPRAMEELEALLESRQPQYARCELAVDTTNMRPDDVVGAILRHLEAKN